MQDDFAALLAAIRKTAESEKAEIAAQGEQEIAGINDRAEAEVNRLRGEALAHLEDQLRAESDRILSTARLEINNRLAHEKNKALEQVFELASKEIAALVNCKDSKEIFKRLGHEAVGRIDSDKVHLRISELDLPLWESLKKDLPTSILVESCDRPKGTVIAESSDRLQSVDNSIDARMEMAREVMASQLAEHLFTVEKAGQKGK